MGVLHFLKRIRMPGINEDMLLITTLGERQLFLLWH